MKVIPLNKQYTSQFRINSSLRIKYIIINPIRKTTIYNVYFNVIIFDVSDKIIEMIITRKHIRYIKNNKNML